MNSNSDKPAGLEFRKFARFDDVEKPGRPLIGLPIAPDGTSGTESDNGSESTDKRRQPSVLSQGVAHYFKVTLSEIFLGSKLNVLLVLLPFAFASKFLGWGMSTTFVFSLLALVPFAERVSFVTEDVAKYTNETLGGLLNATFGNITELLVCIFALKAGLIRVVQVSMLGSVLSNLLLVLGSAFLVGGIRHKEQIFKQAVAVTNSVLLVVTVLALSLPSILDATHEGRSGTAEKGDDDPLRTESAFNPPGRGNSWHSASGNMDDPSTLGGDSPLWLSRCIAVLMLVLYGLLLIFQLITHTYLFDDAGEQEDGDEDGPGMLGFWGGVTWLAIITGFISTLSEFIVDAIEGAARDMKLPVLFLSGILIPIVGNAAEHAAALAFAYRNKMEIALGSAVGSAVQIAVFVIPLCVIIGWSFGQPMDLNFHIFETTILLLTVMTVAIVLTDGRSHWLKGIVLIFAYLMIAASFWAHADPQNMS
jgi:Ca2+:H+ antiporter